MFSAWYEIWRFKRFTKAFEIASNSKYDRYHHGLVSMVHKYFDKKAGDTSTRRGTGISENQELNN